MTTDYDAGTVQQIGPGERALPVIYAHRYEICPFCRIPYAEVKYNSARQCSICGFRCSRDEGDYYGEGSNVEYSSFEVSTLRQFDLSSSEVTFAELASHLRRRPDDYYALSPRRFEELIADVYRNLGYEVELTQETCDGGADIILFNNRRVHSLIQCKRYARSRTVSVGVVREMLGVMVYASVRQACIVATTRFSSPARAFADGVTERVEHATIHLVDAATLVDAIEAYNVALPPLNMNSVLEELERFQAEQNRPEIISDVIHQR